MSFRSTSFVASLLLGCSLHTSALQTAQAVWGATQPVVGQALGSAIKPQLVDVNGDGADDLVYAQPMDNTSSALFVQLSDGAGLFAARQLIGEVTLVSVRNDDLLFADFEGDGDLDVFDLRGGTLALNDGSGTFGPLESIGVDDLNASAAVFGEDTKVTVFGFTKEEPRKFQGYQIDDTGVLAQLWDVSLAEFASLNALLLSGPEDFNGNGLPELRYRLDGDQWLVERTSPTTFEARKMEGTDGFEFFIDLNDDQVVDGISLVSQELGVSLNDGSGTFGEFTVLNSGLDQSYTEIHVADGDGDEVDDLLLVNNAGYRWAFKDANAAEPTYSLGPIIDVPSTAETPVSDIAVGETTGDLLADIVIALPRVPAFPLSLVASAGQTEIEPVLITVPNAGLGVPLDAIVADFDNDDLPDIAFVSNERDEIRWCRQLETGGFAEPVTVGPAPSNSTRHGLQVHDFNLDGRMDILHQGDTQEAYIFQNLADGTFAPSLVGDFGSPNEEDEAIYGFNAGDASGDGRVDLIVSGQSGVGAYFNTSVGGGLRFSSRLRITSNAGTAARLTTVHYEGIRPVFIGSDLGSVLTYAFSGTAFVERSQPVPQATSFLETASDNDGLGLPHLVYRTSQGLGIFERARNTEISEVAQVAILDEPLIADVDNDQDRDLVGIEQRTMIGIRRSNDGGLYSQNSSVTPDITTELINLSVGDVNADGLNDLIICAVDRIVWMPGLSPEDRLNANGNMFPDPWEADLSEGDAALNEAELLRLYALDRALPSVARAEATSFMEMTFPRRINDNRLRYTVETSSDLIEWTPAWESDQLADAASSTIVATSGDFQTTTARWRSFAPESFARLRVQFAE